MRSVYKQSREKHRHFSLYVQNVSGNWKRKKELKICDRSKIIVNHTEWKFTQRGIKSYEKILGELQNKRKKEKENKKQLSVQSRVER